MTTNNRTNEPTEAQVKLALDAFVGGDFYAEYPGSIPYWEPHIRAALVAAAGVTPQAESDEQVHFAPYMSATAACGEAVPKGALAVKEGDRLYADTRFTDRRKETTCAECVSRAQIVEHGTVQPSSTVDEAALIREAKAEARGEALINAVQAHRKLHETYGSTSVCHGGIGGQAMTPHCAEICDNINAHLTEISAWDALELEAVEFSRARAAEYREGSET